MRIDITGASSGKLQLHPDLELGFDVGIWEKDRDGTASWIAWNPGRGKYWNADVIGKLVLVEEDISIVRVLQSDPVFERTGERDRRVRSPEVLLTALRHSPSRTGIPAAIPSLPLLRRRN